MRLNVSKKTFEKYLLDLGYEYKIIDFEKFLNKIRREIYKDLSETPFEELSNKIDFIFENRRDINFSNIEEYSFISEKYLVQLLKNDSLSIFLENEDIKYSKLIQEQAFALSILENSLDKSMLLKVINDRDYFSFLRVKSSIQYSKIKSCFLHKCIYLSSEEKLKIKDDVIYEINEYFLNYSRDIYPEYIEFIFYLINKNKEAPNMEIIEKIIINKLSEGKGLLNSSFNIKKIINSNDVYDIFYDIRNKFLKSYQWTFDVYTDLLNYGESEDLRKEINLSVGVATEKILNKYFKRLLMLGENIENKRFALFYKNKEFKFNFEEMEEDYNELIIDNN